jgi:glycosyltransferase involved in cell wall biosynthesis
MNSPSVIRYVIGSFHRGGAERTLVTLATGLDRARFDPRVTCFLDAGPLRDDLDRTGVPIHDLKLRRVWSPVGVARVRTFARLLADERPGIIHSFGYGADVVASVAGRLARVPWIVTSRRSTGVEKPAHTWVYRALNPLAHRVLAVSEESRRWSVRNEWLGEAKTHAIPNGVDAERYRPGDPESARDGVIRIGTVGNVRPAKGIDVLFRAFARARADCPDPPIRLRVAGRVRDSVRPDVERLLDELGITDLVELVGEVEDVAGFLRGLDVFALPSVREGMSNALLEAIASGLPVVATAVGGNIENVREGRGGMLIRDRDEAAFAAALVSLISSPEQRRSYGAFNRALALDEYSLDAVVQAHAAYYESLLAIRA